MADGGAKPVTPPAIGLALSGGGSRAIAFHLGCLRALHDLGILQRIEVLSTVSGGSVIGALYATTDAPFSEFDAKVRAMLARGLVGPAVRTAFLTTEGPKALLCVAVTGSINLAFQTVSWLLWGIGLVSPREYRSKFRIENWHPPVRRFASRTTILRRAIHDELFSGVRLHDLKDREPLLIINAAELRTGSAFYFTAKDSGSWRLGKLALTDIPMAYAVTASAAFPMFLPALDEVLPFDLLDGRNKVVH
jgi:NTE family protein